MPDFPLSDGLTVARGHEGGGNGLPTRRFTHSKCEEREYPALELVCSVGPLQRETFAQRVVSSGRCGGDNIIRGGGRPREETATVVTSGQFFQWFSIRVLPGLFLVDYKRLGCVKERKGVGMFGNCHHRCFLLLRLHPTTVTWYKGRMKPDE